MVRPSPSMASLVLIGLWMGVWVGCGSSSSPVQAHTLQSMAVSPDAASVLAGKTHQYSATGSYSDGSSKDLTNSVTWTSSSTSAVTIGTQGLATTLTEGTSTVTPTLQGIAASTSLTATALTVEVSVTATDSGGRPLTYRWQSTDGMIQDVNAGSTSWTLSNGPGLHFAHVLVSNGVGGYTETRVAVNTDSISTPPTTSSPISLAPPPAPAPVGGIYRSFINLGAISASSQVVGIPDIAVYLVDSSAVRYPATGTMPTDLANSLFSGRGLCVIDWRAS
jgi:hypothetical protein